MPTLCMFLYQPYPLLIVILAFLIFIFFDCIIKLCLALAFTPRSFLWDNFTFINCTAVRRIGDSLYQFLQEIEEGCMKDGVLSTQTAILVMIESYGSKVNIHK